MKGWRGSRSIAPLVLGLGLQPTRLYNLAHSHICKLHIYAITIHNNLGGSVYHLLLFLHVWPTNHPTVTDVTLCHNQIRGARTTWRWVVNYMPQLLFFQGKSLQYLLNMKVNGPNCQYGHFGEEKNLLSKPWIVQVSSLVAVWTTLSQKLFRQQS